MSNFIKIYNKEKLLEFYSHRPNETKIGESIQVIEYPDEWMNALRQSSAKFVILGIPEDIGVRANLGRPGAYSAFNAALKSFLSMQNNFYLQAKEILLLGEVVVNDLMETSKKLNPKNAQDLLQLRQLVEELDKRVFEIIKSIVQSNKVPIVIGGGHNNAYPIIKAVSQCLSKKINVINCDAHSDLRPMEGRHSGNGFRYALEEGYINHYHILGLHEQYTTEAIYQYIRKNNVTFYTYEDIFIREKLSFREALNNSIFLVKNTDCGIELDIDAITNVPSSARTSSGISPIDARKYIYFFSNQLNSLYLHLAEAAPETAHLRADYKTGKLLAYLICDFIKGINDKNNEIA
ncbi:MAG: arginase [Bacteroidia bacterium]|nr:MAG: arginase [Bacteroidia bacterium]